MIILFLSIYFTTTLVSGSSLSDQVFQTPADIYSMPGKPAKINCHHTIPTYNQILWYKQSKTQLQFLGYVYLTSAVPETGVDVKLEGNANSNQTCTLTVERLSLNSSAVYFCAASLENNAEAFFGGGTKLTVLEKDHEITAPTVKVLHPSAKECKNKRGNAEKTIVCLATRFYPDHVSVSWQVGGEDVTTGVATDNAALRKDKYYTITSRLRVSAKEWYDPNTEFKCTVSFYNGTETTPYSDSIFGDKAKEGVLTREKYLKITQAAKLSYGVFIVKSMVYGVFVAFLVWKLQNSSGKRNH